MQIMPEAKLSSLGQAILDLQAAQRNIVSLPLLFLPALVIIPAVGLQALLPLVTRELTQVSTS